MTHNHCHQSCKRRESNPASLETWKIHSTTYALLLTKQSLAFYSSLVMSANLG